MFTLALSFKYLPAGLAAVHQILIQHHSNPTIWLQIKMQQTTVAAKSLYPEKTAVSSRDTCFNKGARGMVPSHENFHIRPQLPTSPLYFWRKTEGVRTRVMADTTLKGRSSHRLHSSLSHGGREKRSLMVLARLAWKKRLAS